MPDHPTAYIPSEDVYEHGQLIYHRGRKMPYSEAVRLGLIKVPAPPKVQRGKRKPSEDRMRHGPVEDR